MTGTNARWVKVEFTATLGAAVALKRGFVYVPPANEAPQHDADGNLIEDGQWVYTWDAENRMKSATQKVIAVAAGIEGPKRARLEFAYDYRHRRIAKKVFQQRTENGELVWKLVKDLRFVYDGIHMIAELDHTFATGPGLTGSRVNRTFLWGQDLSGTMTGAGGVGGLLSTTYQGVTYQVCSDANGNVTGLVPTSGFRAGQLIARFDYDPFGNRITNTGPDVELCPMGFSTQYTDSETGLVAYLYRYYNPQLGRFASRDPIGIDGGINLYQFVNNDPANKWDYLGLKQMDVDATFHVTYATNRVTGTVGAVSTPKPWEITMRVVPVQADHEFGPHKIEFVEANAQTIYYQVSTPQDRPHEDRHLQDWKDSWRTLITQANKLDGWTSCCKESAQCWVDLMEIAEDYYFWEGKAKARQLHIRGGTSPDGQVLGAYPPRDIPAEQDYLDKINGGLANFKSQIQKKRQECQQKQNACRR